MVIFPPTFQFYVCVDTAQMQGKLRIFPQSLNEIAEQRHIYDSVGAAEVGHTCMRSIYIDIFNGKLT